MSDLAKFQFWAFSLVKSTKNKIAFLQRKECSNQRIEENKSGLEFNFLLKPKCPSLDFEIWLFGTNLTEPYCIWPYLVLYAAMEEVLVLVVNRKQGNQSVSENPSSPCCNLIARKEKKIVPRSSLTYKQTLPKAHRTQVLSVFTKVTSFKSRHMWA